MSQGLSCCITNASDHLQAKAYAPATSYSLIPVTVAHGRDEHFGRSVRVSGYMLYVGTYTIRGSKGIYAFRFDSASGDLSPLGLQAETENPSFLTVDSKRALLYAVNEINDYRGGQSGSVRAYKVDGKKGRLHLLNEVSSMGGGPCHVSLDKTGRYAFVANFQSGSIAGFPVLEDGRLGRASVFVQDHGSSADLVRHREPHAHSVATSPDNRFLVLADLGLDRLFVYPFNSSSGQVTEAGVQVVRTRAGAGPRHFSFHPNGRQLYVVNETDSTVTVFAYEQASGTVHELQTVSTLPDGTSGPNDAAEMRLDSNARFLYVSNRGHDTISVFLVYKRGTLNMVADFQTGGRSPRTFTIDPTGRYLLVANERSDNVVVFKIDPETSALNPVGQPVDLPSPVCLAFFRPS